MRRKSGRNAAKASPEKVVETPRRSRRHSKRRKRSSSKSSSEGSDDVSLKTVAQQMSETVATEPPKAEGEGSEQPVWTVTPTTAPGGEIQKLKICLTRPSPSSPDKNEPTSRRRRNRSCGIQEEEQPSPDETVTRKSRHRCSPGTSIDEQEQNELDDKKGSKGKSKTKHKTKTEKTTKIQEDEDKTENELIENVQVTPQSPHAAIDSVDSESVSAVEPHNVDEIESNSILQSTDVEEIRTPDESNQNVEKMDVDKKPDESSNNQTTSNAEVYFKGFEMKNDSKNINTPDEENIKVESHKIDESSEEDKITKKETPPLNQEKSGNNTVKEQIKIEQEEEAEVVPATTINNEVVAETKTTSESVAHAPEIEIVDETTEEVQHSSEVVEEQNTDVQEVIVENKEVPNKESDVQEVVVENKEVTTKEPDVQEVVAENKEVTTKEPDVQEVVAENKEVTTKEPDVQEVVAENKEVPTKESDVQEVAENKEVTTKDSDVQEVVVQNEEVTTKETDVQEMVVEHEEVANEAFDAQEVVIENKQEPEKKEQPILLPNETQATEEKIVVEEVANQEDVQAQEVTKQEDMQVQEEQTISEPVQEEGVDQISQRRASKTESSSSEEQAETVEKVEPDENTESQSSPSNKHTPEKPEETQPDEDSQFADAIIIDDKEESSFNVSHSFSPAVRELEEASQEIQNLRHEVSDLFPSTPKKRKWGDSATINQIKSNLRRINIDYIKELCPDVKLLDECELKMNIDEPKDRRKSTDVKEKRSERKVSIEHFSEHRHFETQVSISSIIEENADAEVDNANIIAMNRKISIVDDTASKLKPPPSPAKNPISEVLFITNLVRPFTLKQLKELLERTGKIRENGFWTDRIKSKCYVYYDTTEEAEATRNALHGVHWPIGNGKKLVIDYATPEDLETARNPPVPAPTPAPAVPEQKIIEKENEIPFKKLRPEEPEKIVKEKRSNEMHVREWDIGKEEMHRRMRSKSRERNDHERNDKRSRHKRTPSPEDDFITRKQKKKEEEIPQKLMDDLFQKTKTTPSIYWLPLTPEEIATKQQQRLLRMAEHKRRMEESSRGRGDYGRGAPYRRRYD